MIRPAALLLCLAAWPAAAGAQGAVSALKNHDSNAPVDVAADRVEVQDRADRAVFVGNVKARQGDLTLDSQRMTVAYVNSAGNGTQIQRIDASGGVVVTSPSETAKGSFGTYDVNRRLITLIGGVVLTRGANTVRGGRLTIDLVSGRSAVDGSQVGGGAGVNRSGGRVTGHFTVPQRNDGPAGK